MKEKNKAKHLKKPELDKKTVPKFYTVSNLKLIILFVFTFGIYANYWFYKNWKATEQVEEGRVYPILSALFYQFTSYDLYNNVRKQALKTKSEKKVAAGQYAWVTFFFAYLFISFLPIMLMQAHMNDIKTKAFGDPHIRKGMSKGMYLLAILWIGYIVLIIGAAILSGSDTVQTQNTTTSTNSEQNAKKATYDSLTAQYNTCSDNLIATRKTLNTYDQNSVDRYNTDYDTCENIRLQQNAAADDYNNPSE